MEKEILAYIEYLNSEIKERPQCFMVALLLLCKFDDAVLFYDNNHFITLINGRYYDWDGEAEGTKRFLIFPEGFGDSHIVNHYYAIKDRFNNSTTTK